MAMDAVDYDGLIPNNVRLGDDVRVKRALEKWHPGYIGWWMDMGPEGFQNAMGYLRTDHASGTAAIHGMLRGRPVPIARTALPFLPHRYHHA